MSFLYMSRLCKKLTVSNKTINFRDINPHYAFFTKEINVKYVNSALEKQLLTRLGKPNAGLFIPKQVHGSNVCIATRSNLKSIVEADGVITQDKLIVIGVKTADCMPILVTDAKKILHCRHTRWVAGAAQGGYK